MMTRMGPEGKVTAGLMLAGLGGLGGAAALPFAQDTEKAIETVWGWFGLQPDLQADMHHAIDRVGIWEDAGNDFLHGPRPFGVDLGSGIGFGDLISRNVRSPLDFTGAAISSFAGSVKRAAQRWDSGQSNMAVARELMPSAAKHMMDALYPEAGLTSASGATKIDTPENMSETDKIKAGLGFQLWKHTQKYETTKEDINAREGIRQALDQAENRVANLMGRGEDAKAAVADVARLIGQGTKMGIYPRFDEEMKRANADIKRRIAQRLHPEQASRTFQRMEQARQANP
jgi:hypothetical protein